MAVIGRATAAAVSLAILLVPAAVTPGEQRPPTVGAGRWEVAATAANVRLDHFGGDPVVGLATSGDQVEVVDTWTSPLGARWAKVLVTRTRVTGWVLWSLLVHRELQPAGPDPGAGHAQPPGPDAPGLRSAPESRWRLAAPLPIVGA
ncbi:hypothetical protein ABT247_25820 [Kitasatospora sp. NPDC001539]|uniref:hypothetical protein n=1 Tax=Kitasatospora sp. NPDC001539 TaxID=3154384 RepID=UPI00331FE137